MNRSQNMHGILTILILFWIPDLKFVITTISKILEKIKNFYLIVTERALNLLANLVKRHLRLFPKSL